MPPVVAVRGIPRRRGISPDVTVALGLRVARSDGASAPWGLARLRAGVLFAFDPLFVVVGASGQVGGLGKYSLGLEAQFIHMEAGGWLQLGVAPLRDTGGASLSATIGFTLFGIEYQRDIAGDAEGDQALLLTAHVPFGVLRAAMY